VTPPTCQRSTEPASDTRPGLEVQVVPREKNLDAISLAARER
jgi:hypothetical protein